MHLCEPGVKSRDTHGRGDEPRPGRERTYFLPGTMEGCFARPGPAIAGACALSDRPPGEPPEHIPSKTAAAANAGAKSAGACADCVGRHTYIWLKNGAGFWLYPTYSGKRSLSGYRWTLRGWTYAGVILDWIDFFQCV